MECTTAYDPKIQGVARCIVKILEKFKVDFAILAEETCCCGEALRLGDEFLFKEFMDNNE